MDHDEALEEFLNTKPDRVHTSLSARKAEGAVDYQSVRCVCGYIELRFNQVPVTKCPKCGTPLDILDAEYIEE